jgi:hypothetical protein
MKAWIGLITGTAEKQTKIYFLKVFLGQLIFPEFIMILECSSLSGTEGVITISLTLLKSDSCFIIYRIDQKREEHAVCSLPALVRWVQCNYRVKEKIHKRWLEPRDYAVYISLPYVSL